LHMNISNRDKKALIICAGFLMAFIIVQFMLLPTLEKRKTLEQRLVAKKVALEEIINLEREYIILTGRTGAESSTISSRGTDFTLFSFIDTLAEQSGVKDNVAYMKPSARTLANREYAVSMVKIKLDSLFLKEFVDFINRVESSPNHVQIRSLSLSKTGRDNTLIDAIVEAETIVKGDAA